MSSAPSQPDPYQLANAQKSINQSAQRGSMIDQSNPYGSLTYKQTGLNADGTPTYTATSQLSKEQQGLLDALQSSQSASGAGGNTLLKALQTKIGADGTPDFSADAGGLTKQLLDQETSYLNPQFDYQTNQLDAKLRNQGITPDMPAYKQQMMDLRGDQNRAVTGFLAQAEPQAYQQAVSNYTTPISIGQQLASFGSPQSLAAPGTPALGAANVAQGAQAASGLYSNALAGTQYNNSLLGGLLQGGANVANSNGGLGSIIGTGLGAFFGGPAGAAAGGAIGGRTGF